MHPVPSKGDATRSSRNVGAGCDGRCGVSAVQTVRTKTPAAYGEVVWSWRRDPGATLAGISRRQRGQERPLPRGEHEGNRKTIARGKPGCLGCTCQIRVHSFATLAHGAAGAVSARLSLRPLPKREQRKCITRTKTSRGDEHLCASTSLRAKRSNPALPPQRKLDCFVAIAPRNDGVGLFEN